MHFAFTEQGEAAGQTAECGTMFTNLLNWVHAQIESLQTQLAEKLRKIDEEGERALADAAAKRRDEGAADENVGGDERAETRRQDEGRAARKKLEEEAAKPSIEELKEAAALVWIKYMHFVRRTEVSREVDSGLERRADTSLLRACVRAVPSSAAPARARTARGRCTRRTRSWSTIARRRSASRRASLRWRSRSLAATRRSSCGIWTS